MKPLNITTFATCWNEEKLLPYYLRYYSTIATKMVFYDNQSTDKSRELIEAYPNTEIISFDSGNQLREDIQLNIRNTCWKKESKDVDLVIVSDVDEFIFHPNFFEAIGEARKDGNTIFVPVGYSMVSEEFPTTEGQIYEEVNKGNKSGWYNKWALFDPHAITSINYSPGAHMAQPYGRVAWWKSDCLKLLHFNMVGRDYFLDRKKKIAERVSEYNKKKGFSLHNLIPEAQMRDNFEKALKVARPISLDPPPPMPPEKPKKMLCPACGQIFVLKPEDRGKIKPCVFCGKEFKVPVSKTTSPKKGCGCGG
jgi:hypothetical protein